MSRRCARGGARQHGLTLVELLVALVVLSFLMSAVYGALRVGMRSWDAVQQRGDEGAETRVARNLIRRELDALVSQRWPEAPTGPRVAFAGDPRRLRFIGGLTHGARGGGLYLVEFVVERRQGSAALGVRYHPSDLDPDDWTRTAGDALERTLFEGATELRFAYFGSPDGETPPRWHGRWRARAQNYPRLIRIQAAAPRGDWPPLLVPVGAGRSPMEDS